MQFVQVVTHDFDEITDKLHSWDGEFKQLQPGKFSGSMASLRIGPVACMKLESSHAMQGRGILRRPAVVFTPVTNTNHRANWRGHSLTTQHVNVLGANDIMDHVTSDQYSTAALIIENQFLEQLATRYWDIQPDELLHNLVAIRPDSSAYQQLCQVITQLLGAAEQQQPLQEQDVTDLVADAVFQALHSANSQLKVQTDFSTRRHILRQADEYLQTNLHRNVTVRELCQAAGCSERTLQYAFQERYSLTPKAYLNYHRLNAVRQAIKQADPEATSIKSLAQSWSFRHSGEFAAQFQRLFQQLPSELMAGPRNRVTK